MKEFERQRDYKRRSTGNPLNRCEELMIECMNTNAYVCDGGNRKLTDRAIKNRRNLYLCSLPLPLLTTLGCAWSLIVIVCREVYG
jgi:hypothetical protein